MPHLRGLRAEKGGGRLFLLSLSILDRDPSGGSATVRDPREGARRHPAESRAGGRLSFEKTLPAAAGRARVRPDPRVHRVPPPPLSGSRLPSAAAPSLPAPGGGDAAAASPVDSCSLTGEPGSGGTFGGRAAA